jgi:glyoxylase-like metal-dependent hydrolase (beta-lactamase superfamily II)
VKGIILTHYHFDHAGGVSKLWQQIYPANPSFKIICTKETRNLLQNAADHVVGARSSFGDFVGTMDPIPDEHLAEAYEIVHSNKQLDLQICSEYSVELLATPGHCSDHHCPILYKDGKPLFGFGGEAAGTLYHGSQLVSLPTSMPPHFQFEQYMTSLAKLQALPLDYFGLCHFGVISGREDINTYLANHAKFMYQFRDAIIKFYHENPSTRYIITQCNQSGLNFYERLDPFFQKTATKSTFFQNLQVALTYGILIDLGYRSSKYEQKV